MCVLLLGPVPGLNTTLFLFNIYTSVCHGLLNPLSVILCILPLLPVILRSHFCKKNQQPFILLIITGCEFWPWFWRVDEKLTSNNEFLSVTSQTALFPWTVIRHDKFKVWLNSQFCSSLNIIDCDKCLQWEIWFASYVFSLSVALNNR